MGYKYLAESGKYYSTAEYHQHLDQRTGAVYQIPSYTTNLDSCYRHVGVSRYSNLQSSAHIAPLIPSMSILSRS